MAQQFGIYKCALCGNVVNVVNAGGGQLVCCNQPMQLLAENSTDAAQEKHVPVVAAGPDGITVKVGSAPHPMEAEHLIEWIELIVDDQRHLQQLKAGDDPQALFAGLAGSTISARAYCNLHGLWKS